MQCLNTITHIVRIIHIFDDLPNFNLIIIYCEQTIRFESMIQINV